MKKSLHFVLCSLLLVLIIAPLLGHSATFTAANGGFSNWTNGASWQSGNVPGANDNVIIPSGAKVYINDNNNCRATHVTVRSGGRLVFRDDNDELRIYNNGDITVDNGGRLIRRNNNVDENIIAFYDGDHTFQINGTVEFETVDAYNTNNSITIQGNGTLTMPGDFNDNYGCFRYWADHVTISVNVPGTITTEGDIIYFKNGHNGGMFENYSHFVSTGDDIENESNNNHVINRAGGILDIGDDIVCRNGPGNNFHITNYGTIITGKDNGTIDPGNADDFLIDNYGVFQMDPNCAGFEAVANGEGTWHNYANASAYIAGPIDDDLEFFANNNNTTVHFWEDNNNDNDGQQDVFIPTDGAYHHIIFEGNQDKDLQADLPVNGNLTIRANAVLDATNNNYDINLKGNWTNESGPAYFDEEDGKVLMTGTTSQNIDAPNEETFNDLIVNNTSGGGVILKSGNTNIAEDLELQDGIVQSSPASIMVIRNNAQSTAGSNATHVDGPMMKIGSQDFTFPLGDGGYYAPLALSNYSNGNNNNEFVAEYFYQPAPNPAQLDNPPVEAVSEEEYWDLDRTNGSAQVDVTLHWEDAQRSGIDEAADYQDVFVAHYDGSLWEKAPGNLQAGCMPCNAGDNGAATATQVNNFSPFTFGSAGTNPLPVTLTQFQATKRGAQAQLEWRVARERNAEAYIVQRRAPGEAHYERLGRVAAHGNIDYTVQYDFQDPQPRIGENLYRLKMVDLDGNVEYAEVRSLQFQDAELHRFSAYPNPFAEQLVLKGLQADEPTRVRLLNAQGQVVRQQQLRAEQRPALQLEQLPKGAYLLQVHQNGRAYMRRVIKR